MLKTLLILFFATIVSFADILKIGDTLTPFNLPEIFLVSFAKETSGKVNEFLKQQEEGFLDKNKIVYISDIHTMPSFVTSLFALPKMRKYKYTLMLMYEENKIFPQQNDALTVIRFKDNKINSIEFIKEDESIDSIFN